jgi:hypothetical protein
VGTIQQSRFLWKLFGFRRSGILLCRVCPIIRSSSLRFKANQAISNRSLASYGLRCNVVRLLCRRLRHDLSTGMGCCPEFQNSRRACGAHDELTREVTSLHIVLQRLDTEIKKPMSLINRTNGGRKKNSDRY